MKREHAFRRWLGVGGAFLAGLVPGVGSGLCAEDAFSGKEPVFSFTYDGVSSTNFLKTWTFTTASRNLDGNRVAHTSVYTDPQTGLEVRCEGIGYPADDAVEWTVFFTQRGTQDSKIIESVNAVDGLLDGQTLRGGGCAVRYFLGSQNAYNDFEPKYARLDRKQTKTVFKSNDGRSSDGISPFFNVEADFDGSDAASVSGGTLLAVGWPGQWRAEFSLAKAKKVHIRAGQEYGRFKLRPEETARTPLIALLRYRGDWIDGQNAWRRWMFTWNVPKDGGKRIPPLNVPSSSSFFDVMCRATVESQIAFIDGYLKAGIPIDYWWMDAGWYPCKGQGFGRPRWGWWWNTGTWEVNREQFPNGLKPISDYAHARNIKTILWFEPERATPGSALAENRSEWLLKTQKDGIALLNFGLPEARHWMAETISRLLRDEGMDLYRQDFNIRPLPFWLAHDEPDRTGLTENHYVQGYLWFLDELRRRDPKLIIDLCAGGGRRHDLESLRRGIVFTQSDYDLTPEGDLNQSYSLPFLMPYHGHSVPCSDAYGFWCYATLGLHPRWDIRKPDSLDKDIARRVRVWREHVAPCYYGDYYPLTPYAVSPDTWQVCQYTHPEEKRCIVQAFRRSTCPLERGVFYLRGLDRQTDYAITVLDGAGLGTNPRRMNGAELMDRGLEIVLPSKASVSVLSVSANALAAERLFDASVLSFHGKDDRPIRPYAPRFLSSGCGSTASTVMSPLSGP